jgi:hypothetical protein
MSCPGDNYVVPGANPCISKVFQGTYYKSTTQTLTNSAPWNTDVTFNVKGSWNNENGYITHTSGTKDFTVKVTGLYQLEFHINILRNGASWSPTVNRGISIDIARGSEQGVITTNALQELANYNQQVSGTFYLLAGDVINCRAIVPFTVVSPLIQCVQNTFDLNTYFAWSFIN